MSTILFQGNIAKVETRSDRTVKVIIESALELTDPVELAALFGLKKDTVYIAIKEGNFSKEDVESIPEPERLEHEKSPALRLRNVLYRLWEHQGSKGDFELYYSTSIERLISKTKEKLT